MPADPSIYSLLKPQERVQGPLDQYAQMMSIKQLMDSGQLNALHRQQLETDLGEQQSIKSLWTGKLAAGQKPTTEELMATSPRHGAAAVKAMADQQKATAELEKVQTETRAANAKEARDALAGVSDQASYQNFIAVAKQRGWQLAADAPPQFDQKWQKQHLYTADKFLEQTAPKVEYTDVGDRKVPVQMNPLAQGGVGPLPGVPGIQKTTTPDARMADQRQRELNGILEGQSYEPSPELIKELASGNLELKAPPTNARNPIMLDRYTKLIAKVKEANPNWSQEMYPTIKKTVAAFAAGPEAKTMKALNTATDHLETLRELGEAMKNGNISAFNKLANQWATATGGAAPGNLQVASQVIGGEIVKSIVGAGGGVGERERAEAAFSNIKSPEQLAGAIDTVTKLMGGQFNGMKKQYEAGTYGRQDFDKYLSPAAKKALDKAKPAEAPKPAAPTTFDAMPDPAKFNGKLMVDDSGTRYRSNGSKWVRQ